MWVWKKIAHNTADDRILGLCCCAHMFSGDENNHHFAQKIDCYGPERYKIVKCAFFFPFISNLQKEKKASTERWGDRLLVIALTTWAGWKVAQCESVDLSAKRRCQYLYSCCCSNPVFDHVSTSGSHGPFYLSWYNSVVKSSERLVNSGCGLDVYV